MKNYLKLLEEVYHFGDRKAAARPGMPATRELFCRTLVFDLQEGFPAVTTKEMYLKGCIQELLWIISGNTNVKALVDNGVNYWNDDSYKYYLRQMEELHGSLFQEVALSKEVWLERVKEYGSSSLNAVWGSLGRVYGYQWRNWNGTFDQLAWVLNNLKTNPTSRYHLVSSWNPSDFLEHPMNAALPACHMLFQFSVRAGKYLDLMMLQRSCDMVLGVPVDIVLYALLCHIFANILDLQVGKLSWVGNSCHIYENHFEAVKTQLSRIPKKLPTLKINRKLTSLDDIKFEDFTIENYVSHPKIKAHLSVGV